ncbi:MAG: diguanylate cyclase [Leptolyngbyaceae cyanobacterium CSU_1_3]|nr:diguanylate cyclase [Leptolyngbyaceae cyanobacterium CSU_1_3]
MLQSLLRSRKFSLRLILVVPFVLQTAAVVSLTGWISLHNGQKEINDLSSELQSKTTRKVTRYLDSYLLVPHQINQTNLAAINLKLVNPADLRTTGQFFWKQMQIFNVGCINFGKVQGEFVGVERRNNGEFLYHEILRASPNKTSVYRVDLQGRRASLKNVLTQQTGVQTETWFMDAMRSGRPVWSRIYQWQSKPDLLSISSSYPVYDDSQKLLGVIGVNLILSQVGDFLRSLKTSPSGQTFIVERDGLLVASSTAQLPFELVAGQAQRIKASQSSEGVMRSTLQHLNQHFGTLHKIQNAQQLNFHLSGVKQFVSVTPWKDQYGLDWLIVVVVPESDFTEETYQNIRLTILLCLMALGGASTIGIATSTMLVQPILRMVNTANALSAGDWQQQVSESRISEISLLATALNRMAGQLQSSFTTLIYTASHDSLTGLLSRNSFQQKLQEAILHYQESNQATLQSSHSNLFAVLFLDLDHFKFVNDSLGHMVGDQLLVSVARRLSLCLRSIDVIGRFGGDEFIILLNHVANITDVTRVSDRILAEFQQPFNILGNEIFYWREHWYCTQHDRGSPL